MVQHSQQSQPDSLDLQAPGPLYCTTSFDAHPPHHHPIEAKAIEALKNCESRQVALDSWGMAVGVLLFDLAFVAVWVLSLARFSPAAVFTEVMMMIGFGSIWLAIRKPWQDKRPRQAECRRLLEQLATADSPVGANDPLFCDTLRVLSLPISGETRQTRALARQLYLRLGRPSARDLPIVASSSASPADQFPLPANESIVAKREP